MLSLFITNKASSRKIVNELGNKVTVNLNPPIKLEDKTHYHLRLLQANIVYSQPNVIVGVNNWLTYKYSSSKFTPQEEKIIAFDTGLYTLDEINTKIGLYTTKEEGISNLIYFYPDPSTSKIYAMYSKPNVKIYCNGEKSIMPLLGFPAEGGEIGNYDEPFYDLSTNQANLNTIQSYIIKCDITTGSYLNTQLDNVIAAVTPDQSPYSTIIYRPYFPLRCEINVKEIESITFHIVDQEGNEVDMGTDNGQREPELFSLLVTIEPDEMKLSHS